MLPAPPVAPPLAAQQAAVDSLGKTCEFLLEIGVEELPAGDVSHAAQQVENLLTSILQDARLEFEHVSVDATPRRLVATVSGLQTKQADVSRRVRGPPLKADESRIRIFEIPRNLGSIQG
jgi:glycyl-tRNA synthetase